MDTTRRQKVSQRLSCLARIRLLIQPTMPPTRKATATTVVTHTEARIGKTRASTPRTSIKTPSNRVKARRVPELGFQKLDVIGPVPGNGLIS